MCAQYMIRARAKSLAYQFGVPYDAQMEWEEHILPFKKAPVILQEPKGRVLKSMQFSLVPAWSKEPRAKFATHNARLLTPDPQHNSSIPIFQKPTWRDAFSKRRCLVPMTSFIEPIYRGDFAGCMVRFFEKAESILVAAGIWEEWVSKKTGEIIDSFAVITHFPHPFVKEIGHDRTPLFLSVQNSDAWLDSSLKEPRVLLDLLLNNKIALELSALKDREMKPGWEKRIPK